MSKARTVHTLESLKARCLIKGDCWLWQGYSHNNVPQVIKFEGDKKRIVSVRKLLRELISGRPEPSGSYGCTCGDQRCVSPAHTVWRGVRSHMKAMNGKRQPGPQMVKKLREYRKSVGQTKIDESKAQEIRMSSETSRALAERYGVHRSLISRIRSGLAWRFVGGAQA